MNVSRIVFPDHPVHLLGLFWRDQGLEAVPRQEVMVAELETWYDGLTDQQSVAALSVLGIWEEEAAFVPEIKFSSLASISIP